MKPNKTHIKLRIEKFFVEELWQHILVVAFVSFIAWMFNKPCEAVMFCISHLVVRKYFDKQYHCDNIGNCIILTLSIAFFGILCVLPTTISLLSAIPVAFIVCWAGYVVQDRIDLYDYKNKMTEFNLNSCTKEQIIDKCKQLGYSADKIDLAVMFFVDKLSNKKVWKYLCDNNLNVDIDTVRQYRYRIKKDLKRFM